jgi:chaperonin GroEL
MAIKLLFGDDVLDKLQAGVKKVASAVRITLGPKGRNVILKGLRELPRLTNDGVTIAQRIFLENEHEDAGAQLTKMAAKETNDRAGDGTTTAIILTDAIFEGGVKEAKHSINVVALQTALEKYASKIVDWIIKSAVQIDTEEQLIRVATVAANDEKMGRVIGEALQATTKDGAVVVEEGTTLGISWRQDDGISIPIGLISEDYFSNDMVRRKAVYEDTPILLLDKRIASVRALLPLMRKLQERPERDGGSVNRLVIIADDFDPQVLATLILNNSQGTFYTLPLVAPGSGDMRSALLNDYASVIGARVITDIAELGALKPEELGWAVKVEAGRDKTVIRGGAGNPIQRIEQLKTSAEEETDQFNKNMLKDRIATLSNKIAVISVNAPTQVELAELRYRIEDAVNATKAAMEKGIVPGGGIALYDIRELLKKEKANSVEENRAIDILYEALAMPFKQIVFNATGEWPKPYKRKPGLGYDAKVGEWDVPMVERGIIDPAKVVSEEVINASSVAAALLTSGAMITEKPRDASEIVQSFKNILSENKS